MFAAKRRGFTLLELLVVVAIIAILLGLVLISLGPIHTPSRQISCANNVRQVAQGVLQFANMQGRFPGSFEWSPPNAPAAGANVRWPWPVLILPYIGEEERYRGLYGSSITNPLYVGRVGQYTCPSDPGALSGPQLSYAANMGTDDISSGADLQPQAAGRGNGLFHNHAVAGGAVSGWVSISLGGIDDGESQTVLLAENIDATTWNDTRRAEYGIGILWIPGGATLAANRQTGATDLRHSRPSSNHAGGFNAAMADGSILFVDEKVDPVVWKRALTPNGALAAQSTGDASAAGAINSCDIEAD